MSEAIESSQPAIVIGLLHMVGAMFVVAFWICVLIGNDSVSAVVVGPIAGFWFARKYFYAQTTDIVETQVVEEVKDPVENLKQPFPRMYKVQLPYLFAQVRDILEDEVFNQGDKWRVSTDTVKRRITAELKVTEHDIKKYLRAVFQFKESHEVKGVPEDATVMYLEFDARSDNPYTVGLDYYMDYLLRELDRTLRPMVGQPQPVHSTRHIKTVKYKIEFQPLAKPQWWLIGITLFGLLVFVRDFSLNGPLSKAANSKREVRNTWNNRNY